MPKKANKPTPDLNSVAADALAEKIATRLFHSIYAEKAQRLVLEMPSRKDAGGWCFDAARRQIAAILKGEE